ncbi:ribonucleotide-diphosphate reductase subunit beta [bacterium]|nr:ribonucleotide-diphosphate reductase subunit beta [bacterium]
MLTTARAAYRPFKYPEAFEYFTKQAMAHWIPTEVSMAADIRDYNQNLSATEKEVVIKILRLFTTIEIDAEEYWSNHVSKWFPHPEIQQMASQNGGMEAIHIWGYDYLSQSLGLPLSEYEEFLNDPAMRSKKNRLAGLLTSVETLQDKAVSLAVFSAFTEGVSLFSSFAVLMSFSRFGKLKGVANIVAWSVRDESLHSEAGCWLFRKLMEENPELMTDDLRQRIINAARETVDLEDDYIDSVFSSGDIEGLSSKDLKSYIRFRANTKLEDLGLKRNWKNIDMQSVKRITDWFDIMVSGGEHADFFAVKPTAYSKGHVSWDTVNFDSRKYL